MPKPTMDSCISSNIVAHGYDAEAQELYIEFRGGSTYIYSDVPASLHEELKASDSKGSFHNSRIKSAFPFRKAE